MKRLNATVLEQIVDHLDHAVVVVDATRDHQPIVYVNRCFEDMTGYPAGEAVGQGCGMLRGERTNEAVVAEFDKSMQQELAHSAPLTHYRKDGSEFSSHLKVIPLHSRSGRLTHWLWCLATDAPSAIEPGDGPQIVEPSDAPSDQSSAVNIDLDDLIAHDRLTGIHSRKYFEALLERRWKEATDDNGSLSLFMIEIDAFSEYNSTFGRQAGDSCLRLVARAITGALRRASDVGARFAHEEFVALVCDLDSEDAMSLAQRIRERVAALCIHHPRSGVAKYVSVSIGVATLSPTAKTRPARLLREAQEALGKATDAGRNTIKQASNG